MDTRVNKYGRQLTPVERLLRRHRALVGGEWELIGRLQFDYLREQGLTPESTLLDVGCGALRGGVHFADYLNEGNYHGIDINESLLKAGRRELKTAGISKAVHLQQTDTFDAAAFNTRFDFGVSVSLLTHLTANHIAYCFTQMRRVMHAGSRFYFTFFEVPELPIPDEYEQHPGLVTHHLSDPFHYTREQVQFLARSGGLTPRYVGRWGHPRNQMMLELRRG